jgi:hypothetical protein
MVMLSVSNMLATMVHGHAFCIKHVSHYGPWSCFLYQTCSPLWSMVMLSVYNLIIKIVPTNILHLLGIPFFKFKVMHTVFRQFFLSVCNIFIYNIRSGIFLYTISGLEESLKLLLTMHPFTYSLWVKLGHCYQIQMKNSKNNINSVKLKRLSCLVRVR